MHAHYGLPVDCRSTNLFRLAELLPRDTGYDPFILQIRLPAEDRSLEFGCGHHAELLFECSLRPELEL